MAQLTTERMSDQSEGLDLLPLEDGARLLFAGQQEALNEVEAALPAIAEAAKYVSASLKSGARLVYAAAGSSGLMAAADGLELPGTFGVAPGQIRILMAGGLPTGSEMPGFTEDETDEAATADIDEADTVIAVSASGTTPYALAVAKEAKARGAAVIAIANNADTPLLAIADVAICLATPPERIAGSTRMGAGTAQKAALNILSTLAAIDLGHVHDGMMVNLIADNTKLRRRAAKIVERIAGATEKEATASLALAGGRVKAAVLIASGAGSVENANMLLDQSEGHLRAALARL